MTRRPVAKNCRFCGQFMELWWVEEGSEPWRKAAKKCMPPSWCGESMMPLFFCPSCWEWDDEFVDPKYYNWILYEGTIDFKEAKEELTPSDYFALLLEYCRTKRWFQKRPFLAIPRID